MSWSLPDPWEGRGAGKRKVPLGGTTMAKDLLRRGEENLGDKKLCVALTWGALERLNF
jgi:hypothetical protein